MRPTSALQLQPTGQYDACFLARRSHVTGEIHGHEIAWAGDELWVTNTLFSCLCTLHDEYNFVPQWQPPFVTALAAEDRCHLNGVAMDKGRPRFVTAFAETDTPGGWRSDKTHSGCLIDVASGETAARGLCMPHSPRIHDDRVWLLDSGKGQIVSLDAATGSVETVAELPGYTRGLAIYKGVAFVGLSKIRETATFGGVPIAERRDDLKCGVGIVNIETGQQLASLEFPSGVDEIFDIQVLPETQLPAVSGPFTLEEGGRPIWIVPTREQFAERPVTETAPILSKPPRSLD